VADSGSADTSAAGTGAGAATPIQGGATMVNVRVRSIALIRTLLGKEQMDVPVPDGTTIEGVIVRLIEIGDPKLASYLAAPKDESAHAPLRIMVNGRDITVLKGRDTVVADGDDILIFIPIAGG
jgi:molybdopterin converting factor small subunit